MASKQNFVAKHMNTFNRAATHTDRKNDYIRSTESVSDWLDEYEDELRLEDEITGYIELLIEDSEVES